MDVYMLREIFLYANRGRNMIIMHSSIDLCYSKMSEFENLNLIAREFYKKTKNTKKTESTPED